MPITPVSFEEDIQSDEGQYDDIVDEMVEEQPVEVAPQVSIDSRMAEMEERLEMIQYYKLLLNGGFFNSPPNQTVASKIEAEVAEFVLGRLDNLLNMGATPVKGTVESQFTDDEVAALKELASPETHKVLTEVVSRVFGKIASGTAKKAPKAEAPKLATKTVPAPEQPKKAAPAPMTVKARPAPAAKVAAPQAPQPPPATPVAAPAKPQGPGPQRKKYKTVARVNQKTGEVEETQGRVEVTPQARPMGAIQPVPVPQSKMEIESQMEASARRTSNMGLNIFDQKLNG